MALRFAYVVTIRGESCDSGDFCFFSLPDYCNFNLFTGVTQTGPSSAAVKSSPSKPENSDRVVKFYASVFKDLIADGYLSPNSKSVCLDTPVEDDVLALKKIGVWNSIGIFKKAAKPLGFGIQLDKSVNQALFAGEVVRTLKPEGFFVVHTASKDTYSFNSFIDLFNCCTFICSREVKGFNSSELVREIVLKKESDLLGQELIRESAGRLLGNGSEGGAFDFGGTIKTMDHIEEKYQEQCLRKILL